MREMVEAGYCYIAQPPLYSTEIGKEKVYLKDDVAKAEFLDDRPNHKKPFQRLKGLGEMDWEELRTTTMHAGTRTLLQVNVEEAALADEITSILMGDDVPAGASSSPPTPATSATSTSDDSEPDTSDAN